MAIGKVTAATSSTPVVTADNGRSILVLSNDSDASIFLNFEGDAVINQGIVLKSAGEPLVVTQHSPLRRYLGNACNCISVAGGKNLAKVES